MFQNLSLPKISIILCSIFYLNCIHGCDPITEGPLTQPNSLEHKRIEAKTELDTVPAQATANISPEIVNELKDFENLIPTTTIDAIVAKHYVLDGSFRTALIYLRSNEFVQLQHHLLQIPEIVQVLEYLHLTINATKKRNQLAVAETYWNWAVSNYWKAEADSVENVAVATTTSTTITTSINDPTLMMKQVNAKGQAVNSYSTDENVSEYIEKTGNDNDNGIFELATNAIANSNCGNSDAAGCGNIVSGGGLPINRIVNNNRRMLNNKKHMKSINQQLNGNLESLSSRRASNTQNVNNYDDDDDDDSNNVGSTKTISKTIFNNFDDVAAVVVDNDSNALAIDNDMVVFDFILLDRSWVSAESYQHIESPSSAVAAAAIAADVNTAKPTTLHTFTSFVAEVLEHLPHASYQQMISDKCQKSQAFADFYKSLRSSVLKPFVDNIMKTPNVSKVIQNLKSHAIDVKALEPIIFSLISWGPNI